MMSEIVVLYEGYSINSGKDEVIANCSCTLVKGPHNIIVDTMTSWDADKILKALNQWNITSDDINIVVSTHGHSDHIGNNNLFMKAKHIVGFSISFKDKYYLHAFDKGEEYIINDSVKVIPTPGHTLSDVTVLVHSKDGETVAIAGDLFEKLEDIENPNIWLEAGSDDPVEQMKHRAKVAEMADWIIPGHGPQFKVTNRIRDLLKNQVKDTPLIKK
ncbi:metallo-beta-lactamase domain-containing protein 1 [Amyelois transitella]|uniref:metallo-beta-lactamase domain-containing protein 1 n=1 Tax=Amyelois transitella TaxID=680683 RepID=UPI00067A8E0A|nr:metallo-beta-lactamase domain-containing protein 1 [Amyelois transitella]